MSEKPKELAEAERISAFQQEYRQLCERYGLEYRAVARPAQVSDGSVLIRPELIIVQFAAPQLRPANCNVTST